MIDLYQRVTLGLVGLTVLSTTVSGRYQNYLKPSAGPLLLATGILLLLLALKGSRRSWRTLNAQLRGTSDDAHPDLPGHRPSTAWVLLLAPVLCVWILDPPPLGSFTAERAVDAVAVQATTNDPDLGWPPLPDTAVVPLTFAEFIERATWDSKRSLTGRTVRLTGFVVGPRAADAQAGATWGLARLAIACCAADALVYRLKIEDARPAGDRVTPALNTWLDVEGTWLPAPTASFDHTPGDPTLVITRATEIPQPAQPYE